jgi:hypothetical protein
MRAKSTAAAGGTHALRRLRATCPQGSLNDRHPSAIRPVPATPHHRASRPPLRVSRRRPRGFSCVHCCCAVCSGTRSRLVPDRHVEPGVSLVRGRDGRGQPEGWEGAPPAPRVVDGALCARGLREERAGLPRLWSRRPRPFVGQDERLTLGDRYAGRQRHPADVSRVRQFTVGYLQRSRYGARQLEWGRAVHVRGGSQAGPRYAHDHAALRLARHER